MQTDGVAPDAGTYVCILKACTSLGALIDGQRIQSEVIKKGYEANAFVGNTLALDLYAKFAHVAEASFSGRNFLECSHCRLLRLRTRRRSSEVS
jgi:hypothetical protein